MLSTFCPQQIVVVLNSAVGTVHANMLAGVLPRVGLDLHAVLLAAGQALQFVGREEFVWPWAECDEQSCAPSPGGAVHGAAVLLSYLHALVLLPVPPPISCLSSVGGTLIIPWFEEFFFLVLPSFWQAGIIYTALSTPSFVTKYPDRQQCCRH